MPGARCENGPMTMSRWPSAMLRSSSSGVPSMRSMSTSAAASVKRPIAVCRPSSGLVTTPSTMPIRKPADELAALLADALVEGLEVGEELLRRLVGGLAERRHAEAAAPALAELCRRAAVRARRDAC